MSLLRNIMIVGLLVCVAYNGYLIYRNQMAVAQAEPEEKLSEAPLFSSEAFTTLAGNRSQVSVQQAPTVVMPTEQVPSAQPVSNPVLVTPTDAQNDVATVSAESGDLASHDAAHADGTAESSQEEAREKITTEAAQSRFGATDSAEEQAVDQDDAALSFDPTWEVIEEASAAFRLGEALRLVNELLQRSDLSEEQHRQLIRKGDDLAKTVVYSTNKHLALPAHTFLPDSTLEQVAEQHALPLSFLRSINGWTMEQGPTPGDSVKVLQGPISLHVDLPRSGMLVSVGELYAGWVPIDKNQVQVPEESTLELRKAEDKTQLVIGDVAVVLAGLQDSPSPNSLGVASEDWKRLGTVAAPSTVVTWTPEKITQEPLAEMPVAPETIADEATSQAEQPEIVVQPIDALKLEVFTPVGKAIQGHLVRYGLQVSNLSERDSDLVQVVVNLSEGVEPTQVEGHPGRVDVGQAIFDPLTIPAGESVRLTVVVDTLRPGNHVIRPELQCAQPATKYATEVQLQVVAAESISTESKSAEPISAESERQEPEASQGGNAMAEAPQNPAQKIR